MRGILSAKGATNDRKRNAGAGTLVRRFSISIDKRPPQTVQTNIEVPSIPVGKQTLCFFPDRLLVFDREGVGAVSYDALHNSVRTTRFIEDDSAPADTQVAGTRGSP